MLWHMEGMTVYLEREIHGGKCSLDLVEENDSNIE